MHSHIKRLAMITAAVAASIPGQLHAQQNNPHSLWDVYALYLKPAKYVDLTHTITPQMPVWAGFASPTFSQTIDPKTGKIYTYKADGFQASAYNLPTDQLGTQLDPPAHWNPIYPAIDELPPTFAIRPLVVISIVDKVAKDPNYSLSVQDILDWEKTHGPVPEGSVVFVHSDYSKDWSDPGLAARTKFPGVSLAALKFLHLQRHILMHGHETLDTDSTPTLEGEAWLLQNGYTQGEGIMNLDKVPETGALVVIGYPKFGGGTGGYARYIAVCPPDWKYGVTIDPAKESPMPKMASPLHWDDKLGMRVR